MPGPVGLLKKIMSLSALTLPLSSHTRAVRSTGPVTTTFRSVAGRATFWPALSWSIR
jgi:hypothetical protein